MKSLRDFLHQRRDEKFHRATAELVAVFLANQTTLAKGSQHKLGSITDDWACGYVFGAVDAMLQHAQIVHESEEGLALIAATIATTYETTAERAIEYFYQWISKQEEPDFHAGMLCGGTQMQHFLNKEAKGILGLARYLIRGEKS